VKELFLTVIFFVELLLTAFGQGFQDVDSLNQRADEFLSYSPDSVVFYAERAIELSSENNYTRGKCEALGKLGFAYYIKGEYEKATAYCNESIELGKKIQFDPINGYYALGLIRINQSKNDDAIKIFTQVTEIARKHNDLYIMADACSNLGLAYLNKRFYRRAQDYYSTAIKIYENIEHPNGQVFAYLNYGRLFSQLEENDSAYYYLDKSVELGIKVNNERAILHAYSSLGQMKLNEGNLNAAEEYFKEAYTLSQSQDLVWEKANMTSWLAEIYYKKENYPMAIKYGEISIDLAKEARILYIIKKVGNILTKSYLQSDGYYKAENHVKYIEYLIDSLTLADSTNILSSINDLKALNEEEENLEEVNNKLAVAKAEIAKRNIVLIGFIVIMFLLVIILGLIFKSNRIKTKTNLDLKELNEEIQAQKEYLEKANLTLDSINKEKDLLLGIVAHDIRSPLHKISGLIDILKLEGKADKDQEEIYDLVKKTTTDANKLADELLEINRIESGGIKKQDETLTLSDFISAIVGQHRADAKSKNIEIVVDQKCPETEFSTDRKILQRVFENLVSNAIKFSRNDSIVTIELDHQDNHLKFNIIDRGLGIPEEEHSILFTKFGKTSTRPTNGESSNGLGLYIVDRLVKTLSGSLSFSSKVGEGSQFVVTLPVGN